MRYHLNPETGFIGVCKAREGNCPLGEVDHAWERRLLMDAQAKLLSERHGLLPAPLAKPGGRIFAAQDPYTLAKDCYAEREAVFGTLTKEEQDAFHFYAMTYHEYINAHLRGEDIPKDFLEITERRIELMDGVLARIPAKERTTYKYISPKRLGLSGSDPAELERLASAGTFANREFMSTSSSVDFPLMELLSKKDEDLVLVEVKSKKGLALQPSEAPFTGHLQSLETEILLPRGQNFKVTHAAPKRMVELGPFRDLLLQRAKQSSLEQGYRLESRIEGKQAFRVPVVTLEEQ